VALIGGSGFIGTRLSRRLVAEGWAVSSLDIQSPSADDVGWVRCDVRDERLSDASLQGFEAVVHLAALLGRGCSDAPDKAWATNVSGTKHVIAAIERFRVPRAVFFSSSMVHAEPCHPAGSAEARVCGTCLYRESKRLGEALFKNAAERSGVDVAVLRPFTVYGPGPAAPERGHFIAAWAALAKSGLPLPIFGDGEQPIDLLHVDELATLAAASIDGPVDSSRLRVADAGTGEPTSVSKLAEWYAAVFPKVQTEQRPLTMPARRNVADVEAAHLAFGWRAKIRPRDGVPSFLREQQNASAR
jgi:nucleoside-diphosphate-sugar epimerase